MPGGFHPFHAGHAALYQSALNAFPDADVYVAATNSQETRPFPFAVKEKLAKLAGVADKHFVQVKSPFRAEEITSHYNPNEDVLIFVRSEKDKNESPKPGGTKKDGSPSYFQPWTGKDVQPFSKHAYFAYLPTVEFGPGIKSATEIRNAWPKLDDRRKTAMVMSLYPRSQKNQKLAANIVAMLDQVMGGQEISEGPYVQRIVHPKKINLFVRMGKGSRLIASDIPYEILDKYVEKVISKYPQFKQTDFSFRASDKVDEGFGLPMPGTYEQEHASDQKTKRHHTYDLTSESVEADPEIAKTMAFAKQHYPSNAAKQEAFTKFVIHALRHSEQDDRHQDEEITDLQHQIDLLKAKMNVTESQDYIDEK